MVSWRGRLLVTQDIEYSKLLYIYIYLCVCVCVCVCVQSLQGQFSLTGFRFLNLSLKDLSYQYLCNHLAACPIFSVLEMKHFLFCGIPAIVLLRKNTIR